MHRRIVLLGLSAAALAACAPTPRTNPLSAAEAGALTISEIAVATQGAAFVNDRAAAYSAQVGPDLRAALRREFRDRIAAGGVVMQVEVQRLAIAGSTATAFGRDASRLIGTVRLLRDGTVIASYPVDIATGEAAETTAGALLGAAVRRADGYYREVVDRFARDTRAAVLDADLPGERLIRTLGG